jgi:hypothetical protein
MKINEEKWIKLNVKDLTSKQLKKYGNLCKKRYKRDLETMMYDPWCGGTGFVMFNKERIILTWGW